MGFLRKLGGGLGDALKFATPLLAATGVGAPIAAGLGLAGGLMGELNDADGFKPLQGLGAGALSAGASLAAPAAIGKIGSLGGGLPRLGASAAKAGGAKGLLGGALGFAKDNAGLILGGLSALQGARQSSRASGLQDEALELARGRNAELAPVRDTALQRIKALPAAGSTRVAAPLLADPGNPYSR